MRYHHPLPKLDEAGVVVWDLETDTITDGPRIEGIEPPVRLLDDHQEGWT